MYIYMYVPPSPPVDQTLMYGPPFWRALFSLYFQLIDQGLSVKNNQKNRQDLNFIMFFILTQLLCGVASRFLVNIQLIFIYITIFFYK